MKNKLISIPLMVGIFTSSCMIISCKKENGPIPFKNDNHMKTISNAVSNRGRTNNNYSDTFRLVSFTGTKLSGDNTYSAYWKIDWSVVGEKDISYYEIQGTSNIYSGNWYPNEKITMSNPNDSITQYSRKFGLGNIGSGKNKMNKDEYTRLKIVYLDNRVQYSNVQKVTYSIFFSQW